MDRNLLPMNLVGSSLAFAKPTDVVRITHPRLDMTEPPSHGPAVSPIINSPYKEPEWH